MCMTICGDYAAVVLHVRDTIADALAEQIGHPSAGLFEDDLRPAGVPEFGSRRKVNVKIADHLGNQTDLQPNRAPLNFTVQAKLADDPIYLRAAMIARHGQVLF